MDPLCVDITGRRSGFDYAWSMVLPGTGITGVFGPSGAGKTTLLRALAGLDTEVSGTIRLGESIWLDTERKINVPTHRREIGYVFQDSRLFPHLDVMANLTFAVQRSGVGAERLHDAVAGLQIEALLDRSTSSLSGGERQRVAIARALLTQPKLLLMDEPLSANDSERRVALMGFILKFTQKARVPTLYVSHALEELTALANHLVICRAGSILAQGATEEILARSDLGELCGNQSLATVIEGKVVDVIDRLNIAVLSVGSHRLTVPSQGLNVAERIRLQVPAGDVAIATVAPTGLSIRNVLPGVIHEIYESPVSTYGDIMVDTGEFLLRARLTRFAIEDLRLEKGRAVYALIKSASVERRPPLAMS